MPATDRRRRSLAAGIAGIVPALADVAQPGSSAPTRPTGRPRARGRVRRRRGRHHDRRRRHVHAISTPPSAAATGSTSVRVRQPHRRDADRFAPRLDGAVYALAAGPATRSTSAARSGRQRRRAARSGQAVARQRRPGGRLHRADQLGDVRTLAARGNRLYAGGAFSAVNGVNGWRWPAGRPQRRADAAFDARLSRRTWPGPVEDMALSPDGHRLVVTVRTTHSLARPRADRDAQSPARVSRTAGTPRRTAAVRPDVRTYLRGWTSPERHSTRRGRHGTNSSRRCCAHRGPVETLDTGRRGPTWVNHPGANAVSVAVTGSAVYVGGHQQWRTTRTARSRRPGAVVRPGIGAINRTRQGWLEPDPRRGGGRARAGRTPRACTWVRTPTRSATNTTAGSESSA